MEAMANPRPTFIDIQSRTNSVADSYRTTSPSERMQHFAGEIPPTLSPLDAFAAHSRRLAKELDETRKAGQRRISRLPPQVVTESLIQHQATRPHYFRSISAGSSPGGQETDGQGNSPEVTEPKTRPISEYPRVSGVPNLNVDDDDEVFVTPREVPATAGLHQTTVPSDYFGAPRAESPEPVEGILRADTAKSGSSLQAAKVSTRTKPTLSQPNVTFTLAPPNAPFARNTNHNRQHENSDDDYTSSNAGSTFSHTRKLSSNSGVSIPQSPSSSYVAPHARSPSMNSEASGQSGLGHRRSLAHLNFSRPMSSASLREMKESPSRQQSKGSQASKPSMHSLDLPRTPLSFDEERPGESEDGFLGSASSYTYGKFSLPRGRMADRESAVFLGLSTPHFEWQEPLFPGTPPLSATKDRAITISSPRLARPSTPQSNAKKDTMTSSPSSFRLARPSNDSEGPGRSGTAGFSFEFGPERACTSDTCGHCDKPRRPTASSLANSPAKSTSSTALRPSTSQGNARPSPIPPMPVAAPEWPRQEQSVSSRSNSTVRPQTARTESNYQALSLDEHVTKAIELHQHGDLKESTYHLRIAAKQDHPTGMLLYALACRHGWGMRPNQQEGVRWLRKAMDSAMLELADDENPESETAARDISERKTHRAQFALSIYELGVSHLNGWGTELDKALALRCFEIAGDWGDVDALTEAGFCYAEGIGCKKDLRKAARFYRMAADKGVSMVGNSWIYKDKYNETNDAGRSSRTADKTASPRKPRNKSKSRSIFSRKKSEPAPK